MHDVVDVCKYSHWFHRPKILKDDNPSLLQEQLRLESTMQGRIRVYESGRTEQVMLVQMKILSSAIRACLRYLSNLIVVLILMLYLF